MKLERLKELAGIVSESAQTGKMFIVFYQVAGSRTNGSYLVNATDATHAKKIVRDIDSDYVKIRPTSVESGADEYSMEVEDLLQNTKIPKLGKFTHIESGT